MSARAKATTSGATSSCASHSPWEPWRTPSPPRSRATLANRPGPDQPRQERDCRKQRVPLLPRLQRDAGPGVAVDLPRDVIGPAVEREARLREPRDRVELAVPLLAAPPPLRLRGAP